MQISQKTEEKLQQLIQSANDVPDAAHLAEAVREVGGDKGVAAMNLMFELITELAKDWMLHNQSKSNN